MARITTTHVVALIGGGGAGVLILAGLFLFATYQKPDVRYEEGPYHKLGDVAIASVRLQNFGWTDAKEVTINASFPKPLAMNPTHPFAVIAGGKGHKTVTGSLTRIVPGQVTVVVFTVQNPSPNSLDEKHFVTHITYEGGEGRTGRPISLLALIALVSCAIIPACHIGWVVHRRRQLRAQWDEAVADMSKTSRDRISALVQDVEEKARRIAELERLVRERQDRNAELENAPPQPPMSPAELPKPMGQDPPKK